LFGVTFDPENRPAHKLIAENCRGWIGAVHERVEQLPLPRNCANTFDCF
jgi:hypothetical protein